MRPHHKVPLTRRFNYQKRLSDPPSPLSTAASYDHGPGRALAPADAARMFYLSGIIRHLSDCLYCESHLGDEQLAATPGVCVKTKCKRAEREKNRAEMAIRQLREGREVTMYWKKPK